MGFQGDFLRFSLGKIFLVMCVHESHILGYVTCSFYMTQANIRAWVFNLSITNSGLLRDALLLVSRWTLRIMPSSIASKLYLSWMCIEWSNWSLFFCIAQQLCLSRAFSWLRCIQRFSQLETCYIVLSKALSKFSILLYF